METLAMNHHQHRLRDLASRSIPSPIKRVRAKRTLVMSESDANSSCDEEMQTSDPCLLIKPTKLVFDSPEKQDGRQQAPAINVMFCDDDYHKNSGVGGMTPPQSNSTPITKSHSSLSRFHARNNIEDFPPTPKCYKHSVLSNNSHLHLSRDAGTSKVLISNIFSPEGRCLESAKKQYHIKRQRQLLKSFDNVDTKSPSTTSRAPDEDSADEHHPVFDIKSISSTSIDHSRYVLEFHEEEMLGSGDFGEVYKCLKFIDGMKYAVKRTKRPVTNTEEKIFRKEIHAHALLARAPHIVNYFSSWADQGVLYLQLEYCNGGTLENIICDRCPFTENALKQLLFQVSEGLQVMHEMRMIHMDIKPANILIVKPHGEVNVSPVDTERLHYKIGDFGHVIADDDLEVEEGDCRYLPKELLNNNFDNLSKVDIFALGLTLYEASGVSPLPKNGPLWHHIRDGNIERLPNVSLDLYTLIKMMIEKDPTKRPSAREIIQMRASPFCNCICCTRIDSSQGRDFDFKSDYIQKYIEERTITLSNLLHSQLL